MFNEFAPMLTSAVVLAGVVGAILLLGRALRHTALVRRASPGRVLVLRDSLALDTRRRLHLVEHGDRAVLLLTGGETDLVVGWLEGPRTP